MAIVVEHDKRKAEILQKALDVFVEEGYEGKKSKPEGDFKKYKGVLG